MNALLLPGRIEHWPLARLKEACDRAVDAQARNRQCLPCGRSRRSLRLQRELT